MRPSASSFAATAKRSLVRDQVLSAAELAIGRRVVGATRADVQRALWKDRTLVKTFGPRGTVHLLSTADLAIGRAGAN
jgi:hypothetical protein